MSAQLKPTYTQVKNKYETAREVARETTLESLPAIMLNKRGATILTSDISLHGLTTLGQKELKKWEVSGFRRIAWDWQQVQNKYKSHPKRFDLTIWYRGMTLCGASIGKPTAQGGKLRLDYLESSPLGTQLGGLITDITVAAFVVYARTIGATQLRIMNPVNADVRNHYSSKLGFSYDKTGDYCYRDLV